MSLEFALTFRQEPCLMASVTPVSETPPPTRLGRYVNLEPLARGGHATVYKAFDPEFAHPVALKILPPELAAIPTYLTRFEREARATARLHHENVVTVFEL